MRVNLQTSTYPRGMQVHSIMSLNIEACNLCDSEPTSPSWLAPLSEGCTLSVDGFSLQQGQIQLKVLFVFLWLAGCTCQLDFGISSQFWLAPARSLVKSKLCCTVLKNL
jgi:hypothetical protein